MSIKFSKPLRRLCCIFIASFAFLFSTTLITQPASADEGDQNACIIVKYTKEGEEASTSICATISNSRVIKSEFSAGSSSLNEYVLSVAPLSYTSGGGSTYGGTTSTYVWSHYKEDHTDTYGTVTTYTYDLGGTGSANNVLGRPAIVNACNSAACLNYQTGTSIIDTIAAAMKVNIQNNRSTARDKNGNEWTFSNVEVQTTAASSTDPSSGSGLGLSPDSCYDGASSLGWILCPVLKWLSATTEGLYSDHIEPAMEFEVALITSEDTNSGTYGAWQIFREIANIFFIILLIIVIFSQLTGVGIDNYGIKRILPKLIVAAVIVNLSFILCQLLVDVSNIVGSGIKDLMDDIAGRTAISVSTIEGTQVSGLAYAATGGLELAIAVFASFVGVFAIVGDLGLLLPLLLGLISGVISIFFLFLLLAVRKAAIVVLIAVSPIALVCFALPNTKKVFDVWWKSLSALLLLYPICGLLIGGGGLASKIILSTGGGNISFFLGISAFVCAIAPIFFIPTLLRGSFKALGNIGATISKTGQAFKSGTLGRFAKSDARQRMQTGLANWDPGRIRANAANSRFAKSGVGRILTANMNRSYAMNAQAQKKQRQEDEAAATILAGNIADYRERKDPSYVSESAYQERLARALERGDEQTYRAELHEYERHTSASKAANGAMLVNERNLAAGGSGLLSAQNSADFLRRLGADFSSTFAKTPDYSRFLSAGGMNGDRHVRFGVNYIADAQGVLTQGAGPAVAGTYLKDVAEHGDIKPEQYAGANPQTLTRQMENEFLTQDVAQQIMGNKDLTKGMDVVARLIVAARAENGTTLTKKEAESILGGNAVKGIDQAHAQFLIRQAPDEVNVIQRFSPYNKEDGQYDSVYVTNGDNNADSRKRKDISDGKGKPQTPAPPILT